MIYDIYEWKIRPKTSFLSKLHSDIIWGHIIWAISYIEGAEYIEEILKDYNGGKGAFIVSNGFLSGYVPFVRKGYINSTAFNSSGSKSKKMTLSRLLNRFESIEYIDISVFNEMRLGKSESQTFREILEGSRCPLTLKVNAVKSNRKLALFMDNEQDYMKRFNIVKYEQLIKEVNLVKNSVDRLMGGGDEDAASTYNQTETFYDSDIAIYIKLSEYCDMDRFVGYLDFIELNGFGSRSSAGKGQFETVHFKKADNLFDRPYEGNGFITLSNYIPKSGDYEEIISGRVNSKRGKLSGGYAGSSDVFKKPFAYYEAGAVFKGKPDDNKGKMLKGLHRDKNIVQYGIPFVLGVNIDE